MCSIYKYYSKKPLLQWWIYYKLVAAEVSNILYFEKSRQRKNENPRKIPPFGSRWSLKAQKRENVQGQLWYLFLGKWEDAKNSTRYIFYVS